MITAARARLTRPNRQICQDFYTSSRGSFLLAVLKVVGSKSGHSTVVLYLSAPAMCRLLPAWAASYCASGAVATLT